jgi:hypothetical protein
VVWRRLHDNSKYYPGKDSPENYYINDDVCWCFQQHVDYKQIEDEQYERKVRQIFVEGHSAARDINSFAIPNDLVTNTLLAQLMVASFYLADWHRNPYEEELAAIYDLVMQAR